MWRLTICALVWASGGCSLLFSSDPDAPPAGSCPNLNDLLREVVINGGSDDAEFFAENNSSGENPGTKIGRPDLALGKADLVGLRFDEVALLPDTRVTKATIRFTPIKDSADGHGAGELTLSIVYEDSANSMFFQGSNSNDLRERSQGGVPVSWTPGLWDSDSLPEVRTTEDLSSLVKAAQGLDGWTSQSALTFIISGNGAGFRNAAAQDNPAGLSPPTLLLCIEQ